MSEFRTEHDSRFNCIKDNRLQSGGDLGLNNRKDLCWPPRSFNIFKNDGPFCQRCKIMESVCRSTVCKLNTDAAPSRHLGKYLKSNLETKQSTCACLVVNLRKKLSFISRRVGYVNTLCITCNLISDKNVCEEDPPVMFYIFKYLQSSWFLLWGELWAETCNSFVGCDIFSSRSTSKILGVPKTIIFTGVV